MSSHHHSSLLDQSRFRIKAKRILQLSDRDLLMLMNLNGRERTLTAFEGLCRSVTPQLKVQKVHRPEQGELSLMEITRMDVHWETQTNGHNH